MSTSSPRFAVAVSFFFIHSARRLLRSDDVGMRLLRKCMRNHQKRPSNDFISQTFAHLHGTQ